MSKCQNGRKIHQSLFDNITNLANTTDERFNTVWHALKSTNLNSVRALQKIGIINHRLNQFMAE